MTENQKQHAIKYLRQIKESIESVKDLLIQTTKITTKHLNCANMDILTAINEVKGYGKKEEKVKIEKEVKEEDRILILGLV